LPRQNPFVELPRFSPDSPAVSVKPLIRLGLPVGFEGGDIAGSVIKGMKRLVRELSSYFPLSLSKG
jgi:hypothetical protein